MRCPRDRPSVGNDNSFLILHGTGGNAPSHWQEHLAQDLRAAGKDVRYPSLPSPDVPRLAKWLPALKKELAGAGDNLTVLAHSRSCALWLHYAAEHAIAPPDFVADRVLLVAPPYRVKERRSAHPFFPVPLSAQGVANVARQTTIIASDDDEYASFEEAQHYASTLNIPIYKLPSSGHISPTYGYGNWPWMLQWCLGASDFPPQPL